MMQALRFVIVKVLFWGWLCAWSGAHGNRVARPAGLWSVTIDSVIVASSRTLPVNHAVTPEAMTYG